MAWGRSGLASRIDRAMELAGILCANISSDQSMTLYAENQTGVVLWRPDDRTDLNSLIQQLPKGSTSLTSVDGQQWLRNVAANPCADIESLWDQIKQRIG